MSSAFNRRYLSGFDGSNGYLLVGPAREPLLLTDFRYTEQAANQSPHFQVVQMEKGHLSETLKKLLEKDVWKNLALEEEHLSFSNYTRLAETMDSFSIPVMPVKGLVEKIRMIKEEGELALLRYAASLTDRLYTDITKILSAGRREKDVALDMEMQLRRNGGEVPAFSYIVASGQRGALPHGVAEDKIIEVGDTVTLDFGIKYRGYNSDMTRNVKMGRAGSKDREIWQVLMAAREAALAGISAGAGCAEVDNLARTVISDAGMGQYFGHGLGHGVGLAAHEGPTCGPRSKDVLQPGMVVTVEPGIYIPGWGGMRIEDMVLVTPQGYELLTHSSRELMEIN